MMKNGEEGIAIENALRFRLAAAGIGVLAAEGAGTVAAASEEDLAAAGFQEEEVGLGGSAAEGRAAEDLVGSGDVVYKE